MTETSLRAKRSNLTKRLLHLEKTGFAMTVSFFIFWIHPSFSQDTIQSNYSTISADSTKCNYYLAGKIDVFAPLLLGIDIAAEIKPTNNLSIQIAFRKTDSHFTYNPDNRDQAKLYNFNINYYIRGKQCKNRSFITTYFRIRRNHTTSSYLYHLTGNNYSSGIKNELQINGYNYGLGFGYQWKIKHFIISPMFYTGWGDNTKIIYYTVLDENEAKSTIEMYKLNIGIKLYLGLTSN